MNRLISLLACIREIACTRLHLAILALVLGGLPHQLEALTLSGLVYDDANGLKDATVNGDVTNVGGTLFANLLDPNDNSVLQTTVVAADGSYQFTGLAESTSYSVLLSTFQGSIGDFAPAAIPPVNWVFTGEHLGSDAGDDVQADGVLTVTFASDDLTNANFGIEQAPEVDDVATPSQPNPGRGNQVTAPTLSGTDPEDPALTTFVILDLPVNASLVYDGSPVTPGQRILNYDPSLMLVDPDDGSITVSFTYLAEDAAGEPSAPATASMTFSDVSITGHVLNDVNALADGIVNGTGTDTGGGLYALLNLGTTANVGSTVLDGVLVAADGSFTFASVVPNTTYTITLTTTPWDPNNPPPPPGLPAGWVATGEHLGGDAGDDGSVDGMLTLAVGGASVANANLGIWQVGTLTGHLYMDTNGNGSQDDGEPDLPSAAVYITDHNGSIKGVLSDANGNWSALVPVGTASIHVDQTFEGFPAGVTQTEGADSASAVIGFGTITPTVSDGYFLPATIFGHLYIDANGNGAQDGGEPDLANVPVNITNANGDMLVAITDSLGRWTALVPPGVAIAAVDLTDPSFTSVVPDGYLQTEGNDPSILVATIDGPNDAGTDGYFIPATVTGHLYLDTNGNGIQDDGEPGLAGDQVIITDANGVNQTVTTDANGDWSASVPPGQTIATVDTTFPHFTLNVPSGFQHTEGDDPTTVIADANIPRSAGNDGYFVPALVTGHLFIDANGDGTQNAGEPNLANVEVLITDALGHQQTVSSDVSGSWTAGVPPGLTTVEVNTSSPAFPAGGVLSTGAASITVTATASGVTFTTNNGYFIPALVHGHLYIDTNGSGVKDAGEPDLPNVDVDVTDSNGTHHIVSTNTSGVWSASVPPGVTTAKINLADTDFTTAVAVGYVQTEGDDPTTFTAVASADTFGGNDGFFIPAIVSGHLYVDSNGNGTQDAGEPNLANVNVLISNAGSGPQTVATNGLGNWTVVVAPGPTTATVDTSDSDFTAVITAGYTHTEGDDPTTVTAVANATTSGGIDGYHVNTLYSISGQVRFDANRDGNLADNDPPLSGFTVKLYNDANSNGLIDPANDLLLDTQQSGADGNYHFTGYPNGHYIVVETPPNAAIVKTNDKDGNNDRSIPLALAGADSTQNDFLEAADPQGWFYDTDTGAIVTGGSMAVVSVPPGGAVTMLLDGTSGEYAWLTNGVTGTYTMAITPPTGYTLNPSRPAIATPLDPSAQSNPYQVGSSANGPATDLQDFSAGANPWYLSFALQTGDPAVLDNNIPLLRNKPVSFAGWQARHTLGGLNGPTDNPDGDDYSNLLEFAFCDDPATGVNTTCPLEIVVNTNGTIDAVVHRLTGAVGLTYELQYIADLSLSGANDAGWTTITTISPVVVTSADGSETNTYQNLAQINALASGSGFVREKVTDSSTTTVARTVVSGWSTRALTTGAQTCGNPFLPCEVFGGKVDAVGASTLDVTTSVGTQSVAAQFVAGGQYYVEVTHGTNESQRWEIDKVASTATSLAIDLANPLNTQPTLPTSLATDNIVVRKHLTFKEVFPPASFHAAGIASAADRILFSAPGSSTFTIYWLFTTGGQRRWVDAGNATLADVGGHILDSCQGVYIHPRATPVSLVQSGHVRQNACACQLPAGATMISGAWPMDQSPAGRLMSQTNGFTGGNNARSADKILFWTGDDTAGAQAYDSHFLLSAGTHKYWTEVSDAALTNEDALPLFKALRANFIQSIAGKSNWLMPLPWTP